jgi:DNA repair exonuclease SbcCD ATPase subunit
LETYGADVSGLQQDVSIAEDDTGVFQDLSDVVAALAQKLSLNKTSEKAAEKLKALQESLALSQKETDELKALKSATEKRLEASKAAARGSRAEAATVSAEVDSLREQLEQRTDELKAAQGKITGSVDAVSSEVQALEEENIELMKENMELRKETSTYRLEVDKVKAQLIKQSGGYIESGNKAKAAISAVARTPNPVENQENIGSTNRNAGDVSADCSVSKSLYDEKGMPLGGADGDNKMRRARKVKPLVDTTTNAARSEDAEGVECAQS